MQTALYVTYQQDGPVTLYMIQEVQDYSNNECTLYIYIFIFIFRYHGSHQLVNVPSISIDSRASLNERNGYTSVRLSVAQNNEQIIYKMFKLTYRQNNKSNTQNRRKADKQTSCSAWVWAAEERETGWIQTVKETASSALCLLPLGGKHHGVTERWRAEFKRKVKPLWSEDPTPRSLTTACSLMMRPTVCTQHPDLDLDR